MRVIEHRGLQRSSFVLPILNVLFAASLVKADFGRIEYRICGGICGAILVLCNIGVNYFPSGPFTFPSVYFWRLVLSLSICYLLFLAFLLFQSKEDARQWIALLLDSSLGKQLPEKSYAENCSVTFDNIYVIFILKL